MPQLISAEEAAALVKDGMTIMVSGFLGVGSAEHVLDAVVASGAKNLKVIVNDASFPHAGAGKLFEAEQAAEIICSYVGSHPKVGQMMQEGTVVVRLIPQGTLIEMIRCGGNGLGGVLSKVGLGTQVAETLETVTLNGEEWLYAPPLHADIAFIGATKVDGEGNAWYHGTSRNYNPTMATAADIVVCEAKEIVETGQIAPDDVHTPGILIDYVVDGKDR